MGSDPWIWDRGWEMGLGMLGMAPGFGSGDPIRRNEVWDVIPGPGTGIWVWIWDPGNSSGIRAQGPGPFWIPGWFHSQFLAGAVTPAQGWDSNGIGNIPRSLRPPLTPQGIQKSRECEGAEPPLGCALSSSHSRILGHPGMFLPITPIPEISQPLELILRHPRLRLIPDSRH